MAWYCLVTLCWTNITRPNDPVPRVLMRSKSSRQAVFCRITAVSPHQTNIISITSKLVLLWQQYRTTLLPKLRGTILPAGLRKIFRKTALLKVSLLYIIPPTEGNIKIIYSPSAVQRLKCFAPAINFVMTSCHCTFLHFRCFHGEIFRIIIYTAAQLRWYV